MRAFGIAIVAATVFGLSGCSQNSFFKKKPHYHTSDGTAVYTESVSSVATTSAPQTYQSVDQSYTTPSYTTGSYTTQSATTGSSYSGRIYDPWAYDNSAQPSQYSPFAGSDVQLYSTPFASSSAYNSYSDPRDTEFVKLNGEAEEQDWRNCEIINHGYLFISEYNFSLHPEFEVCMRNKGYVTSLEYGPSSKQTLTAAKTGLRGSFQSSQSYSSQSYSTPTYSSSSYSSGYPSTF